MTARASVIPRDEQASDPAAIRALVTSAFAHAPHSDGREAAIVDGLRDAGALTFSLVAEEDGEIVGHLAVSPVGIDGEFVGWHGLGPVAVRPDRQRSGIGRALIEAAIERILALGAHGVVVLGDPAYYGRFGFRCDSPLVLAGVPAEYFQAIRFGDDLRQGAVDYHPVFFAG